MTLLLFALYFAAAFCCGAVEGALCPLRKNLLITVFSDIALGCALVIPFATITFALADGRVFAYAVFSAALGFTLGSVAVRALLHAITKKRAQKHRQAVAKHGGGDV